MDVPDVSYARNGDVAIAYQVIGEGGTDVVFVRGTLADLLAGWDSLSSSITSSGSQSRADSCCSTSAGAAFRTQSARSRRSSPP